MRHYAIFLALFLILPGVMAATLTGTVYNANLDPEPNVLVEVNSTPQQQFLARDGGYRFTLSLGDYSLIVSKGTLKIQEDVRIIQEGEFIYDLFLVADLREEEELLQQTEQDLFSGTNVLNESQSWWLYLPVALLIIALLVRVWYARKKYGSLPSLWKRKRLEEGEERKDAGKESEGQDSLAQVLAIMKKHDGRMAQKELRQELMHLSEAKVSLMVTELEHQGKIEKIKRGRGNVIIVK